MKDRSNLLRELQQIDIKIKQKCIYTEDKNCKRSAGNAFCPAFLK